MLHSLSMRLLIAAALLMTPAATAQVLGRLTGSIVDPSSAPVPDAKVSLYLPGGASEIVNTKSTAEGLFSFTALRPENYRVVIEAPGFTKQTLRQVKVDPARETSLPPIRLEIGSVTEVVEVTGQIEGVQTSNTEIAVTITHEQIHRLPVINRSPLALIKTQAGVSEGRGPTVINGQRTSYASVTVDGINIQDNFIRSNSLDYLPNLLLLDQISEATIITSNSNSAAGGGSSQVAFNTPSGSNPFHGQVLWWNRNNILAANSWFDNKDGIERPFLNQNQVGGALGGPIVKDKLLFYANYEAFRLREKSSVNRTILTQDARNGIYTYRDVQGNVRKVNILQAVGATVDPAIRQLLDKVPGPDKINNFRAGDSREDLLRNTGGYSFVMRDNRTRDNATLKIDYNFSTQHAIFGAYAWNRDVPDRGDVSATTYDPVPKVINDNFARRLSVGWRWSPGARFTNEVRGGFNLAPGVFRSNENFGQYLLTGTAFSNPINPFRTQGRDTDTYMLRDDAGYLVGRHNFKFGFLHQAIRVRPFNEAGITPTYTIGIGTGGNVGLSAQQLPAISATDLAGANTLLATLNGYISAYSQNFNITNRTSGFVAGAPDQQHLRLNNYAFYFQDDYKVLPRLTVNLGIRYDYFSPIDERDALALLPVMRNNNPVETLLSNSTLDFAGKAVGRPWYKKDLNNFAPNVGLAWDVFGDGKMALRAGYSVNYANDELIRSADNNIGTNDGLNASVSRSNLAGTIRGGLPPVPTPAFKVPRTFADNNQLDPFSAFGLPDPNLRTPYIQQWTIGIQRDFAGNILEVRYVGNHATKQWRAFDFNQVIIHENGFLDDFRRAQQNGELARARTGVFNATYNAAIPGSQRLVIFDQLPGGGLLTNATVRNYIETGQVGELANIYQTNRLNGPISFYRNPFALGTNMITNYSNSSYNALQIDLKRRLKSGLELQANYTYAKVLSDSDGTGQTRFEAFLDMNNAKIERARAPFDITHAIKQTLIYDIPMGRGHRFNYQPLHHLLDGWSVSNFIIWQSGTPFSVNSARGTFNRGARSGVNTANTTLNKSQLDDLFQFRMTGNGPFFVAASAIGPDGRAVGPDGRPPLSGQVFFHPEAGSIGTLQRRMFSGPWTFNMDFTLMKATRITERHTIEFRMNAANVFNNTSWFVGDQGISSTQFGRITSTFYDPRVIDLGLTYRF